MATATKSAKRKVKKKVNARAKGKATKRKGKAKASSPGRPAGTPNFQTKWLAVRDSKPFARKNAVEPQPGTRRIVIECSEPDAAVQLEKLEKMINKKDSKLRKLIGG